jgi:phospholipid transport system substrate-binding protein
MLAAAMGLALTLGNARIAEAGETPTAFLKAKDKKLKPLLADTEKNKKKILKTINSMMDFDTLCKDSLGAHWDARTGAEQKDFSDTLRALIEKNLIKRLRSSKDNIITYGAEKIDGDKATVVTTVKAGSDPRAEETEVVYKMRKKGATWIVVDMETDGVSLVQTYRNDFNKNIKNDGWEALMKKMKDKLAEKE